MLKFRSSVFFANARQRPPVHRYAYSENGRCLPQVPDDFPYQANEPSKKAASKTSTSVTCYIHRRNADSQGGVIKNWHRISKRVFNLFSSECTNRQSFILQKITLPPQNCVQLSPCWQDHWWPSHRQTRERASQRERRNGSASNARQTSA